MRGLTPQAYNDEDGFIITKEWTATGRAEAVMGDEEPENVPRVLAFVILRDLFGMGPEKPSVFGRSTGHGPKQVWSRCGEGPAQVWANTNLDSS